MALGGLKQSFFRWNPPHLQHFSFPPYMTKYDNDAPPCYNCGVALFGSCMTIELTMLGSSQQWKHITM